MQETDTNKDPKIFEDAIDLIEVFHILFKGKWIIVYITTLVSTIGIIYSLLLPNLYESKAIMVGVNPSKSISGSLSGYSGLAGLAGINLSSSGQDNSVKAQQKITSLSFFENNILNNIYLPDLMAIKSWNPITNEVLYDENVFDTNTKTWIEKYSNSQQQIPSAQKSFKIFKSKHLTLKKDNKSGFITLSIKHQSPLIAKQWTELVVDEINNFYRQKDKIESEKAASYLNQQILMTSLTEIKQVLSQLLQEEIKKLTLIEANEFYVFEYIDPPAVMEKKSEPNRALICVISTLLGGMLGILLVLLRYFVFRKKPDNF